MVIGCGVSFSAKVFVIAVTLNKESKRKRKKEIINNVYVVDVCKRKVVIIIFWVHL